MVIIFNLLLGVVTPPVGLVILVLSSVTDVPVKDVIRGMFPVCVPLLITSLLVTFVPPVSTLLTTILTQEVPFPTFFGA
jgi:TRAP-type C4-dicarboxylate transport system permease large subunit